MKDLLDAPLLKLVEVLKQYTQAVKENDILELHRLKMEHAELFTDEFRQYIREWLGAFGVTDELLTKLNSDADGSYNPGHSLH